MERRYKRRVDTLVTAVQLRLDVESFTFAKWGGTQRATSGDWVVDNGEDVYTVKEDVFAKTYEEVDPGRYRKTTAVMAREASEDGKVQTLEGATQYRAGDYIVRNEGSDDFYAIEREKFEAMYEPADQ